MQLNWPNIAFFLFILSIIIKCMECSYLKREFSVFLIWQKAFGFAFEAFIFFACLEFYAFILFQICSLYWINIILCWCCLMTCNIIRNQNPRKSKIFFILGFYIVRVHKYERQNLHVLCILMSKRFVHWIWPLNEQDAIV